MFRGMEDHFRHWYGRIVNIRSLLPSAVPIAALTATATTTTREKIVKHLQLHSYLTVQLSPDRPNVKYSVVKAKRDLFESFNWLIEQLSCLRVQTPKVVIFCRSIATCASLYKLFLVQLGSASYEPVGSPSVTSNRLFAMYHAKVDEEDKKEILKSMTKLDGTCRVLFSTIAFGMGVDIPDIRTVIHFGPSSDIDDYFQESGRCGRDGQTAEAILYFFPGCLLGGISPRMKLYCQNANTCRRRFLLQSFIGPGQEMPALPKNKRDCCDICANLECPYTEATQVTRNEKPKTDERRPVRDVSLEQRQELRQRLEVLRRNYLKPATDSHGQLLPLYSGAGLACGLSDNVIDSIVSECESILTVKDLEDKCLVWGHADDNYYAGTRFCSVLAFVCHSIIIK